MGAATSTGFEVPSSCDQGTNVHAAREILEESRSDIPTMQTATDLADAARKIGEAVAA